ncbi:SEC-C domain-containing protein [Bacillus sp. FJAT-29953]|nr:SEC-C domain-containing protein [Bacillus sp. FJAT-29953]
MFYINIQLEMDNAPCSCGSGKKFKLFCWR